MTSSHFKLIHTLLTIISNNLPFIAEECFADGVSWSQTNKYFITVWSLSTDSNLGWSEKGANTHVDMQQQSFVMLWNVPTLCSYYVCVCVCVLLFLNIAQLHLKTGLCAPSVGGVWLILPMNWYKFDTIPDMNHLRAVYFNVNWVILITEHCRNVGRQVCMVKETDQRQHRVQWQQNKLLYTSFPPQE